MKLKIQNATPEALPDELRRRRGALIDALCEELEITNHKVEHEVNMKQRERRELTDYLVEQVIIDGITIELKVRALEEAGVTRNKLELRYAYVLPGDDDATSSGGSYSMAKEPKDGFDMLRLTKRIVQVVAAGIKAYVRDAINAHAESVSEDITNEFGASPANFQVEPSGYFDDGDFGSLRVTFHGLCDHLVVKLIKVIIEAHEQQDCGGLGEIRERLAARAAHTPDKELN